MLTSKYLRALLALFFVYTNLLGQEINSINFEGSKKVNTQFLKNLITSKEGDQIKVENLENDIQLLQRLPVVAKASYQINKEDQTVTFNIVDNTTIIPFLNVFGTLNNEIGFVSGINEHNFLKRSLKIGGWYQRNIYNSFGFNFGAPYLIGNKYGISINASRLQNLEPLQFGEVTTLYKFSLEAAEIVQTYRINTKNEFRLGTGLLFENYQVKENQAPDAPDDFKVNKKLIKLAHQYNNLKYDYYLVTGLYNETSFQYITDDYIENFNMITNDFRYFKKIKKKGNWSNRIIIGLATNNPSPFAPFVFDNNTNIRGAGVKIQRGTSIMIFNTEYRHTLLDKKNIVLQSNLFIDSGFIRESGKDLDNLLDSNQSKTYGGIGARLIHKRIFGLVLRGDFGFDLTHGNSPGFVFGVGQFF